MPIDWLPLPRAEDLNGQNPRLARGEGRVVGVNETLAAARVQPLGGCGASAEEGLPVETTVVYFPGRGLPKPFKKPSSPPDCRAPKAMRR